MQESRRAGRVDRDAVIAHLNTAYTKEYLSEPDREERVDKASKAVTLRNLEGITADLPSVLEMEGKVKVPGRVHRLLAGTRQLKKNYIFTSGVIVLGVITAILSLVIPFSLRPHNHLGLVLSCAIPVGIIAGIAIMAAGIVMTVDENLRRYT